MAVVISDAGPLIALAKIDHLNLLHLLFGSVLVTKAVIAECIDGKSEDATRIEKAVQTGLLQQVENPIFQHQLSRSLGIGEQSSIEFALQQQEKTLLIIDDALARKHALRHEELAVIGTAAILFTAQQRKLVDDAEDLILQLNQVGYRISPAIVAQLKQKLS
jgi:predicted nucleic acid-binding protein